VKKLEELEKGIGVEFKDKDLLQRALTHRSYLNENGNWPLPHNERLEYLGDAVLELAVSEFLFRHHPKDQEGQLTSLRAALVNTIMLGRIAREISLENYLLLSKGEEKDIGRAREAILANTLEALIGAIYIDQGYEPSKVFIEKFVLSHLKEVLENKLFVDPKSFLQEIVQERLKVTPVYKVLEESGPDHDREFLVGVFFEDRQVATGKGPSKQEAEREAAAAALGEMGENG
jgi:ribonuclease-3